VVRRILLFLDDGEFERLKAMKGGRTWKEFLVDPVLKGGGSK
jgi:hypothetical protein